MNFRILVYVTLTFCLAMQFAEADETSDQMIARVEGVLDADGSGSDRLTLAELMKRYHVPGVSIAVIRDNEIHWAKGYGIADVVTGKRVDTDTLFQAASISKVVNAMAALKAIQDERFGLDDDINSVLKSWTLVGNEFTAVRRVTPRMLMSHTSGTNDGFGFPGYHPDEPRPTLIQILDGSAPSKLGPVTVSAVPFTRYKYSGGGIVMMQLALMDAVEKPYEEIMQEYVLEPIGMSNSTFTQPLSPERDANASRAHNRRGEAMNAKWHVYPEQSAAGLWTTPTDLCMFVINLKRSLSIAGGGVLSRELAGEMVAPVGIGDFGVGFSVWRDGSSWYFGHGGSNWGFRSNLTASIGRDYGMVVMTNGEGGGKIIQALVKRVSRAYHWDTRAVTE